MSDVERHAGLAHRPKKIGALGRQAAGGTGAVSVGADAEVRDPGGAQTTVPPETDMSGRENRIGALHAEDVTERAMIGMGVPLAQVGLDVAPRPQLPQLALRFQNVV